MAKKKKFKEPIAEVEPVDKSVEVQEIKQETPQPPTQPEQHKSFFQRRRERLNK